VITSVIVLASLFPVPPLAERQQDKISDASDVVQGLSEELAIELSEQLRLEASWSGDFRAGLQAYLLKRPPRDPGAWPMQEPAPTYDPRKHCPAQPIPRRRLKGDDPKALTALERFKSVNGTPGVRPGWVYDYASRGLRRIPGWDSPKRLLTNALYGSPPDQDLAIAILELHLDSGELQATFRSFSHAYADRKGVVFPGVTLYDAWASGSKMEMPDVECLGIVHDLLGDWKTWKAPVRKQESLYEKIGELFFPARQHRGLRHSLAVAYLAGAPEDLGGYSSNHLQLHALWEECASTPPKLTPRLPSAGAWRDFLEDWGDNVAKDGALQAKARNRSASLAQSALSTQELVLRILRENELLNE